MDKVAFYKEQIYKSAALNEGIQFNPFQKRVLNNPNDSVVVAHPVGSGKTLTGIAKFEKLKSEGKAHKALVVVPAGLRDNFGTDGVKKFTNSKYNIVGNKQEISKKQYSALNPNSDYNIMSYEMFRKDPEKYIKESGADTVIADEFHRTRNEGTSTGDSFKGTRHLYKNFIGLTGSLVNNGVSDVQPLVDIASGGNHKLGKTKKEFDQTYVRRSDKGPYKYVKENRRPVIGFNYKKILQNELGKFVDYADTDDVRDIAKIPKKEIEEIKVPITKEQLKIYKGIINKNPNVKKLIQRKRLETMKDDEIAKAYNDLIEARKLMNSVGSVVPGIDLKTSSRITPKAKRILDDLDKHIRETPDGQAILLTNLIKGGSDVLEAGLKDRSINYGKFIGKGNEGVTEQTRQNDIKDYKNRKKRVMIISGAGAEGLSLNDTTWEGLFDPHYNPERMNQMEARGIRSHGLMHRPEELRKVHVNRYVSTMPKTLGIIPKSPYKTPDQVIYEIAHNKDKQNQMLYKAIKEHQNQKGGIK
jgi:SNF2 family DNA or RNA helicase